MTSNKEKPFIIVKGHEFHSKFNGPINKDKCNKVRNNFFPKNKDKALKQLKNVLLNDKVMTNYIFDYYFSKIACDTTCFEHRLSVNEVLNNDEYLTYCINKASSNKKLYPDNKSLTANVKTVMRMGGAHFVRMPSNFSLSSAKKLLMKYIDNNDHVYIDPCAGWGTRMIAAAVLGLKYIAFDVNEPLINKLIELGNDIKEIKPEFEFKLYKQGSQYYVKELNNTADIIMTSPPYFNLEDYGHREFEVKPTLGAGHDWFDWISNFVDPLMENLSKYIKKDKYILINVKDFNGKQLEKTFIDFGKAHKLKFVGYDNYDLSSKRKLVTKSLVSGKEHVLVFRKEN